MNNSFSLKDYKLEVLTRTYDYYVINKELNLVSLDGIMLIPKGTILKLRTDIASAWNTNIMYTLDDKYSFKIRDFNNSKDFIKIAEPDLIKVLYE